MKIESDPKRRFLLLISELSAILSRYNSSELGRFRSMAQRSFPLFEEVIGACEHASRLRGIDRSPRSRDAAHSSHAARLKSKRTGNSGEMTKDAERFIKDTILSKVVFPSNSDIFRALQPLLSTKISQNRPSRTTICSRIITAFRKLPPDGRDFLLRELVRIRDDRTPAERADRDDGFFAQWERVVKGS